ncbi:MAG: tetratricopeptide repeat protein [Pseudomonadota bacterium]
MKIMLNRKDRVFEDLYSKHLNVIQGIEFTRRQIDVMACIVSGWDVKSVAARLAIAPSTVETHINTVGQKIGSSGRHSIRKFIERSGKDDLLRQHYKQLTVQVNFEKELKEIARLTNEKKLACHIHYDSTKVKSSSENIKRLKRHLELSGIQLIEISPSTFPDFYVVIIGADTSELSNPEHQKEGMQTIFLSLDPVTSFKDVQKSDSCLGCFALGDFDNYYLFVLNLLATLLPKAKISESFDEFKTQNIAKMPEPDTPRQAARLELNRDFYLKFIATSVTFFGVICVVLLTLNIKYWDTDKQNNSSSVHATLPSSPAPSAKEQGASMLKWNLPLLPDPYIKRTELLDSIWSQFEDKDQAKQSTKIIGVVGLGGIGKTFLAMYAIHYPRQSYKFRAWLNAENESSLKVDYFEIGNKLKLFSDNMSDAQKIREVKTWIENKGSTLLVYDNAPNMVMLYDYLPNNAHIIVTSSNHKLKNAVEVDVMTKKESFALLEAQLPSNFQKGPLYKQRAAKLLNELHYTPLAISQAAGYITENAISISNYLKLYETEREHLLSDSNTPLNITHDPVYATWELSLNSIKKTKDGEKALDLLNFISFCQPASIPKSLLVRYLSEGNNNKSECELNRLLGILRQYSLIKISGDDISVHRLVSSWLRNKLDQEQRLTYLKGMKVVIDEIYPGRTKNTDLSNKERHLIDQTIPRLEEFLKEVSSFTSDETQVSIYTLTYRVLNEPHKAEHILEEALKINESLYGENHPTNLHILTLLGSVYHHLGKSFKKRDAFKKIAAISEKTYGKEHPKTALALFRYGTAHMLLGEFRTVKNVLAQTLVLYQKHYGNNHAETAQVLYMLGWINYVLGLRIEGKTILDDALYINSQSPTSISSLAYNQILLGFVYYDLGHLQKSETYFRNALKIRRKLHGDSHIWTALSMVNLALACAATHKTSESKQLLAEAFKFVEKDDNTTNAWISILIARMGIVHCILGDYLQSKKLLIKSIEKLNEKYGEGHLLAAIVSANLGNVYRLLGDVQNARKLLQQSLKTIRHSYGKNHPTTAMAMANLALTLENTEKKELLKKSLRVFKDFYLPQHINIEKIASALENEDTSTANVSELENSLSFGYHIFLPF